MTPTAMTSTASKLLSAGLLTAAGWCASQFCLNPGWSQSPAAPEVHRESELDPPAQQKLSVEQARDRARLMHDVSIAALESMHRTYFQREKIGRAHV